QKFRSPLSPWKVFQNIAVRDKTAFFLDSIQHRLPDQNYSYLGSNPFLEILLKKGRGEVKGAESFRFKSPELLKVLAKMLKKYSPRRPISRDFFCGGAVGFWGYELAALFEKKIKFRSKPGPGTPDLYLGFFSDVMVYDHQKKFYWLVSQTGKTERLKEYFLKAENPESIGESESDFHFRKFRPEIAPSRFEAMVKRAKDYIAAGDIYQANLSQRFYFDFQGSPLKLYDALRKINPSPFSSFLQIGDLRIISSSPERLVRKHGNFCETRPIAGTRPRNRDAANMAHELLASEKERAEHIMLVDLERNDLGRVCDWRSVKVEEMMKIEKYSHVLHIVSKITGKLSKGKTPLDLIGAMFPGGTITGCPKIRCMEIIDELEPAGRGIYTGSIGYLDFRGNLDLNIVIRTLILQKNEGYLQVGAGIVHDSNPRREYEETLHKGEALVQALVEASISA
ncbi:MAG: anthranilate synthase component I family protein, partial [Candidatus Omnitrophica bacterium]|nr:anthranilate synthase component I family protein [Candidatus Omnitrophota bacterium]